MDGSRNATEPAADLREPRPTPATLLARYTGRSRFFFSSPRRTLLADLACDRIVGPLADPCFAGDVRRLLSTAGPRPLVVAGALPFDPQAQAALEVYAQPQAAGARRLRSAPAKPAASARALRWSRTPSRRGYMHAVAELVRRIDAGELDKAVLAQQLELTLQVPADPRGLLHALLARNPSALCFAVRVGTDAASTAPSVLVGASPELLVARRGRKVFAQPMAGSLPRSADPLEDRRLSAGLLRSAKDQQEHRLVVESVHAALAPLTRRLRVPSAPSLVATPTLWHLATRVEGELADPHTTSLDLAAALHPTPAVCGSPAPRALELLRELEGFDRGHFAGAVGYCDHRGDGEWAVSIRCAELRAQRVRLFAGAGIVAESDPRREHVEINAKLATMLHALGVDSATVADAGDGA